ncbi:MAG: dihydrofolate reductase, partial [Opitutales bacterium]
MIRMIAACARNRVMGINGTLPWKIERDWEHFLETTRDGVMVMGRRCYEDFVEHARNRKVIALSRNPNHHFAYAQRADCLSGALEMASTMGKNTWICGGEEIYREAMPWGEELYLTQIDASFEGDAFFPSWEEH